MTEPADEIAALPAKRDDLQADWEHLRETMEDCYSRLRVSISDIYALQSYVSQEEAREADDRLAPIRRAIGWDPYPKGQCPLERSATVGQPSIEQQLNRLYQDTSGIEDLLAEVNELERAVTRAMPFSELDTELSDIADWLRTVAPEGTPYLGKRTDEATRQAMIAAWLEAAEALEIEVIAPYSVDTEDGPLPAIALLVGFGPPKGTLILDLNDFHLWLRRACELLPRCQTTSIHDCASTWRESRVVVSEGAGRPMTGD